MAEMDKRNFNFARIVETAKGQRKQRPARATLSRLPGQKVLGAYLGGLHTLQGV